MIHCTSNEADCLVSAMYATLSVTPNSLKQRINFPKGMKSGYRNGLPKNVSTSSTLCLSNPPLWILRFMQIHCPPLAAGISNSPLSRHRHRSLFFAFLVCIPLRSSTRIQCETSQTHSAPHAMIRSGDASTPKAKKDSEAHQRTSR